MKQQAFNFKLFKNMANFSQLHGIEPGQVRHLYIWVHPKWNLESYDKEWVDFEINECRKFIDRVAKLTSTAIVQIPDGWKYENMGPSESYDAFLKGLEELNQYANNVLNGRYMVWDHSGFIDGDYPKHVDLLVNHFKLVENDQSSRLSIYAYAEEPKYLASIRVFGKEHSTCPFFQTHSCDLKNLASKVDYLWREIPTDIAQPDDIEDLFSGFGSDSDTRIPFLVTDLSQYSK